MGAYSTMLICILYPLDNLIRPFWTRFRGLKLTPRSCRIYRRSLSYDQWIQNTFDS